MHVQIKHSLSHLYTIATRFNPYFGWYKIYMPNTPVVSPPTIPTVLTCYMLTKKLIYSLAGVDIIIYIIMNIHVLVATHSITRFGLTITYSYSLFAAD